MNVNLSFFIMNCAFQSAELLNSFTALQVLFPENCNGAPQTTLGYRPSVAQRQHKKNKARCGRHYRLANAKVKALVGHLFLDLQWSPEEISNRLIYENCALHISYNPIYRAIYRGFFNDTGRSHGSRGAIRKLRHRGKARHTTTYGERHGQIPVPHTIRGRPVEAQLHSEIGHLEVDTVVWKTDGQCLVTMVDRKTRYLLAKKATHKRTLLVNHTMHSLIATVSLKLIKTLTPNRGSEFAEHTEITKD